MPDHSPIEATVAAWVAGRHQAVLVTVRGDGTPQTSNVAYTFDGVVARVSVTAGRAKTHNLRRDPRAVLHVLGDTFWAYASVTCTADLSAVSREPGDEVGRTLLALHDSAAPPHPDPDEFFRAMVDDEPLVLTLRPLGAVGMGIDA